MNNDSSGSNKYKAAINITAIAVLFFINLFTQNIFSQEPVDIDSIKAGQKYKITLYDDKELIGVVISIDSQFVKMKGEEGIYKFRFDDIFMVDRDITPAFYKYSISLKGGITFFVGDDHNYYNGNQDVNGFNIGIDNIFPFRENKAARIEFEFTRLKRKGQSNEYRVVEPANLTFYSMRVDFLWGEFRNKSKFTYFFGVGGGIHYYLQDAYRITERYNFYNNDTTQVWITDRKKEEEMSFMIGLGGHAGYKFTKNIEGFAEVQYNFASKSLFLVWGGGYFPLRAGITYIF